MAKATVEGYRTIDIRYLERKGFLVPGTNHAIVPPKSWKA